MSELQSQLQRLVLYTTAAIGYALTGYVSKVRRDPDIQFDVAKFMKTILVGIAAGVIMAARGDDVNPEAYAAAAAIAIPIVDEVLNNIIEANRDTKTSTR